MACSYYRNKNKPGNSVKIFYTKIYSAGNNKGGELSPNSIKLEYLVGDIPQRSVSNYYSISYCVNSF